MQSFLRYTHARNTATISRIALGDEPGGKEHEMKVSKERNTIELFMIIVLVFLIHVFIMRTSNLAAQINLFTNPRNPTISPVPEGLVGTWKWSMPRQSCGSTVDSYGGTPEGGNQRANSGIPLCQW